MRDYNEELQQLVTKHGAMAVTIVARAVFAGAQLRIDAEQLQDAARKADKRAEAETEIQHAEIVANITVHDQTNYKAAAAAVRNRITKAQKRQFAKIRG